MLFPEPNSDVVDVFAPAWNTMTVLRVPQAHAVRARAPALEIFDLTVSFPLRGRLPSLSSPERLFAVDSAGSEMAVKR